VSPPACLLSCLSQPEAVAKGSSREQLPASSSGQPACETENGLATQPRLPTCLNAPDCPACPA
jgi:hypothetical protein